LATFHHYQPYPTTTFSADTSSECSCSETTIENICLRTTTRHTSTTIIPHHLAEQHQYEFTGVPCSKWTSSTSSM
jgi:hypothetical protein